MNGSSAGINWDTASRSGSSASAMGGRPVMVPLSCSPSTCPAPLRLSTARARRKRPRAPHTRARDRRVGSRVPQAT
eukprot:1038241-Rhodomonas_salina.2